MGISSALALMAAVVIALATPNSPVAQAGSTCYAVGSNTIATGVAIGLAKSSGIITPVTQAAQVIPLDASGLVGLPAIAALALLLGLAFSLGIQFRRENVNLLEALKMNQHAKARAKQILNMMTAQVAKVRAFTGAWQSPVVKLPHLGGLAARFPAGVAAQRC